jgi:ribosomal protein S18 acetylase RimI-like enzyme
MIFTIRPFHPSDLPAIYRICVLTSDDGEDASYKFPEPDLLGHIYAGPYGVYEPDLCFILTADGAPAGYILGARDTQAFNSRCNTDWLPVLRQRYPLPPDEDDSESANCIRHIHSGFEFDHQLAQEYPAHLHIDLLAVGRGQGLGRKMMETFLNRLRELHVPAVHLGVGGQNHRAIAFYRRMGFHAIHEHEWGILFGMNLH